MLIQSQGLGYIKQNTIFQKSVSHFTNRNTFAQNMERRLNIIYMKKINFFNTYSDWQSLWVASRETEPLIETPHSSGMRTNSMVIRLGTD